MQIDAGHLVVRPPPLTRLVITIAKSGFRPIGRCLRLTVRRRIVALPP